MSDFRIEYNKDNVKVVSGYKCFRPWMIKDMCRWIWGNERCPDVLHGRGWRSLGREWMAHNLLYFLGYQVERTRDVDLNDEPRSRRMAYFWIAALYRMTWPMLVLVFRHRR